MGFLLLFVCLCVLIFVLFFDPFITIIIIIIIIILIYGVFACMYVCMPGTQGSPKKELESLEVESQMVVSCLWVLEMKPRSSGRESALNC